MSEETTTDREFDFFLTEGRTLQYAAQGGMHEGTFIRCEAPSPKVSQHAAFLKQAFVRASSVFKDMDVSGAEAEQAEGKKPSGEEVVLIIAASDVDLGEVLAVGRKLLTSGVAKVEGEAKLTTALIDAMGQDDFERLVGDYIVNFTASSLFSKTKRE